MWRELIAGLTPHAEFTQPASEDAIARAARALGGELPEPPVSLHRETDGVRGQYGLGVVWPLRRILDDNTLFRSNPDFRGLYTQFRSPAVLRGRRQRGPVRVRVDSAPG